MTYYDVENVNCHEKSGRRDEEFPEGFQAVHNCRLPFRRYMFVMPLEQGAMMKVVMLLMLMLLVSYVVAFTITCW